MYTSIKPAAIQWGNAVDQNPTQYQGNRPSDLASPFGKSHVKGGDVFLSTAWLRPGNSISRRDNPDHREVAWSGFPDCDEDGVRSGAIHGSVASDRRAVQIEGGLGILTNPVVSYLDSEATYKAFRELEFLVVNEIFMTPTAAIADLVLLPPGYGTR